jgi:hypothetical protein
MPRNAERPYQVAIVGSGPSGFFADEEPRHVQFTLARKVIRG